MLPAPEAPLVAHEKSARARADWESIQAALGGQAKAYEELLQRYRTPVLHLVLKIVRDADDAEDVTMETFGKAFRHLGRYSPDFAFSTWLFRIATNNCIDFVRRKKLDTLSLQGPAHLSAEGECTLQVGDEEPNPLEAYVKQQRKELVQQAVAQLPATYSKMLRLRYFNELSYEEVATELQCPLGTVKANLHRARALLAEVLEGSEKGL
jgi:RNA polymerase sigma factor (sigma-70 family)